jgi:chromosome segregation ATPase
VDKFEIYVVRNILKVPRHLDLSATAGGPGAISAPAQEEQLDADLEELRRKVHQAEFVNRAMEKKVQDLQEHVKQYQGIKAVFDEADKKLEEKSLPPLEALVSDVLYIDPEMRSLEKQYRVLEADRAKENTPMDMEAIDTHFARCKGNMGGASTRTMDQLGTLLGAR